MTASEPGVKSWSLAAIFFEDWEYSGPEGGDDITRAIRRTVINNDHLQGLIGLAKRTFDRFPEKAPIVIVVDDNADEQTTHFGLLSARLGSRHSSDAT